MNSIEQMLEQDKAQPALKNDRDWFSVISKAVNEKTREIALKMLQNKMPIENIMIQTANQTVDKNR